LWNGAQTGELENMVILSNGRVPFNHAVWTNTGACAYSDIWTDDAIGADGHRAVKVCPRVNNSGGVNERHTETLSNTKLAD
jgi:hypothetical protein